MSCCVAESLRECCVPRRRRGGACGERQPAVHGVRTGFVRGSLCPRVTLLLLHGVWAAQVTKLVEELSKIAGVPVPTAAAPPAA